MKQFFYARQHAIARICQSISIRPSVRLTRVDHAKTVEVRIMLFSPYGSFMPLVSGGYVLSRNSDGVPPERAG